MVLQLLFLFFKRFNNGLGELATVCFCTTIQAPQGYAEIWSPLRIIIQSVINNCAC